MATPPPRVQDEGTERGGPRPDPLAAGSRRDTLDAWGEFVAAEGRAGRQVPASRTAVLAALVDICRKAGHRGRVSATAARLYYVQVEELTGLAEATVQRAMADLRRWGFLLGAPNPPDPTDDWHREPGTYALAVPRDLAPITANQLRWRAEQEAAAALSAALTTDHGRGDRAFSLSLQPPVTRSKTTPPAGGPGDGGRPPPGLDRTQPFLGATDEGRAIIRAIRADHFPSRARTPGQRRLEGRP